MRRVRGSLCDNAKPATERAEGLEYLFLTRYVHYVKPVANRSPNGTTSLLKVDAPIGHTIESDRHRLDWNGVWFVLDDEEVNFIGSNGTYTFTVTPTREHRGFVYMNDDHKTLRRFDMIGSKNFTISGLKTLSGTLTVKQNDRLGNQIKSDSTVIGDVRGNVVTLNSAALPENPTSNATIQFTANTFDYNFKLGSDVDVRTFAPDELMKS